MVGYIGSKLAKNIGIDLEGAKENYERALKICRDRLGEDHPNTMTVRNNLDAVEREIGCEGWGSYHTGTPEAVHTLCYKS